MLVFATALTNTTPAYACTPKTVFDKITPITDLTATYIAPKGNAFNLWWNDKSLIKEYEVQVKQAGGLWRDAVTFKTPVSNANIIIPQSEPNKSYVFRVRIITRSGEIGPWEEVTGSTQDPLNAQNWTIDRLRAVRFSDTKIHLLWSPLRDITPYRNGSTSVPKGYEVQYKEDGGAWQQKQGNSERNPRLGNVIMFTDLKPNTKYSFRVRFNLAPWGSSNDAYGPWATSYTASTLPQGQSREILAIDQAPCGDLGQSARVLDGVGDDGIFESYGRRVNVQWHPSSWATEYEIEIKNLNNNQGGVSTHDTSRSSSFTSFTGSMQENVPYAIRIRNQGYMRRSSWSWVTAIVANVPKPDEIQRIQDGDLIRYDSSDIFGRDIYIVKRIGNKNFKRLILNPQIFDSYQHLEWSNVKSVSAETLNYFTTSNLVMEVNPNGTPVNGRVYRLIDDTADTGKKRHIQLTPQQFEQAGGDWDSVYHINHLEASNAFYRTAQPITTTEQFLYCGGAYSGLGFNCFLRD